MPSTEEKTMDSLVSTDWLSRHLDDPDLVVLDCTVVTVPEEVGGFHNESGVTQYQQGHIPGAGFADLKRDLCDTGSSIEFAVPSPQLFCDAMGRLGVGVSGIAWVAVPLAGLWFAVSLWLGRRQRTLESAATG